MPTTLLQALRTWQEAESRAHRLRLDLGTAVAQLDEPKAERVASELREVSAFSAEMQRTMLDLLGECAQPKESAPTADRS